MKKSLLLLLCLCLCPEMAFSDLLESTPVGPGITHHHEYRSGGPWHLHILEIDLEQEWVLLETAKANDRLAGYERTSSQAARHDQEGHRVVGAINGDFYASGGIPIGAQGLDGILLKRPAPNRSVFGTTAEKRPFIDVVTFAGQIASADDLTHDIDDINDARLTDELVLYNRYFGSSTGANYWGTEVTAEYLSGQAAINDTVWLVTTGKDSVHETGHGNNTIPQNGLVISGHDTSRDFLNEHVFVGDTLSFVLRLPPTANAILELIGGGPRLIRDGTASIESVGEGFGQNFASDRHPRTAAGFSQDSTKIYLFTVDGRQAGYSVGMSLYELADYMLEWGVFQGLNLDGGDSSTMVVRGQVANSPSDAGGERSVANALMVISTAPTGPLAVLRIAPAVAYVLSETQLPFSAAGFDQYYNPVTVHGDSLQWSCDAALGNIDEQGLFTAASQAASGHIFVSTDGVRDSAMVYITDIASIELMPNPVILEIGEEQAISPEARDSYGNLIDLSITDYAWSLSGEMGQISSSGIFTATQAGSGHIIATYNTVSGSSAVLVGTPADVILDDFSDLSNWSLTGVRVDLSECSITIDSSQTVSPPTSGRLHYSLQTGGTSALYLDCSIPISGTPEAIGVHVYGDGRGHWLRGEFKDSDGEKFLVNFTTASPGIDWTNAWYYLEVIPDEAEPHWGNPSAVLSFPLTWTKIYLAETDDAAKDSGTVFLDDLTASFITTTVENGPESSLPILFRLQQNYPNPFNPSTLISFQLSAESPVRIDVYNTLGQHVRTLLNEWRSPGRHDVTFQANDLASGIYLYRIQAGGAQETKKMVLLK